MGIKDNEGASYTPSSVVEISENEYLHSTAYTQKFKTLYSYASKSLPTNPTKISKITFTAPSNISKGQQVSLTLSNYGYNNVYDCTTWGTVYTGISYKYYGYKKSSGSSGTTKTKTFLIQDASTAIQNFAFDMEE